MNGLQRYRIERELGRGAMGVVHLAYDLTLERQVALKELVFNQSLGTEIQAEMLERFQREARAAARLGHPNVVQVYDVFDDVGRHFIAMELLEGESLGQYLEHDRLSVNASVSVMVQVLDALDAAHSAGIVHRDIKPDNIFILNDGRVKVADFGIAKVLDAQAGSKATQIGTLLGTPGYMSPEQVMGLPADGRSDLFSLGVVGYELLAGVNPFEAPSPTAMLYRIANESPPSLTTVGVPGELAQAIATALSKQPENRYQTARSMSEALQGHAVAANPVTTATSPRSRSTGLIAAAAAIAAVSIGAFVLFSAGPPRTTVQAPVTPTESAVIPAATTEVVPAEEPAPAAQVSDSSQPETPFWGAFFYANESRKAAAKKATKIDGMGFRTLVLDTGDYASIGKPGTSIWVVCVGPFDTESEAADAARELKQAGIKGAYAKEVY